MNPLCDINIMDEEAKKALLKRELKRELKKVSLEEYDKVTLLIKKGDIITSKEGFLSVILNGKYFKVIKKAKHMGSRVWENLGVVVFKNKNEVIIND